MGFSPSNKSRCVFFFTVGAAVVVVMVGGVHNFRVVTLPETAPENGWLEYDRFLSGWPVRRGEMLVSGCVHSM